MWLHNFLYCVCSQAAINNHTVMRKLSAHGLMVASRTPRLQTRAVSLTASSAVRAVANSSSERENRVKVS